MKRVLSLIIVVFVGLTTMAQTQKCGHIDMAALTQVMPETKAAEVELQKFGTELENQMTTMQEEFQALLTAFQSEANTMSQIVLDAKQSELQDMERRITAFQNQASIQFQQKQGELMQPIIKKADDAIKAVAKENNLLYVFDLSSRVVLYKSNDSVDMLPLVKKHMGIQ